MFKKKFPLHKILNLTPQHPCIVSGKSHEKLNITVSYKIHDEEGIFCVYLKINFLYSISDKFDSIFELTLNCLNNNYLFLIFNLPCKFKFKAL